MQTREGYTLSKVACTPCNPCKGYTFSKVACNPPGGVHADPLYYVESTPAARTPQGVELGWAAPNVHTPQGATRNVPSIRTPKNAVPRYEAGDVMRVCESCRHWDPEAYAFENHFASGRLCSHRDPYEPDLSPYHGHPAYPFITHSGACCRAWECLTFEQQIEAASVEGRLF